MTRKYDMKQCAKRQEETRRRFFKATLELHKTVGMARTTISAIGEKAGCSGSPSIGTSPTNAPSTLTAQGITWPPRPHALNLQTWPLSRAAAESIGRAGGKAHGRHGPVRYAQLAAPPLLGLIHPSAWNRNSPKFISEI